MGYDKATETKKTDHTSAPLKAAQPQDQHQHDAKDKSYEKDAAAKPGKELSKKPDVDSGRHPEEQVIDHKEYAQKDKMNKGAMPKDQTI